MIPGRREFLRGAAAAFLLGCESTPPAKPVAPRPRGPMGIDMHNHVYPVGTEPHAEPGRPTLDLSAELTRSGLTAVCASFVLDFAPNHGPGDARTNYLQWLTAVDAELEKGHLRRALTLGDLENAHEKGSPVIVQSVEGAHFIEGELSRIDEVYARGLRHLQLLHDRDDLVSPLGDTIMGHTQHGGLTPFGADVIRACNRRGILVDMAHATPETLAAAVKASSLPIVVSHTHLDRFTGTNERMAQMMKPRALSAETAKLVADAGGVVGVWTKLTTSAAEHVESIKMMVDAIGIDHVGVGTDSDLLSSRPGQGTNANGRFFVMLTEEMRRQGLSETEIDKIGGRNFARVFGKATVR